MPRRSLALVLLAAVAGALSLMGGTARAAATATVTGDDGQPVAIAPNLVLRNMEPTVNITFPADEKRRYSFLATGPTPENPTFDGTCRAPDSTFVPRTYFFQGNGVYTAAVKYYAADDTSCQGAAVAEERFAFSIIPTTSVVAPGPTLLTRKPGEFATLQYPFAVGLVPGAGSYDLQYGQVGVGPDGGPAGQTSTGFVDVNSGTPGVGVARLRFDAPGTYRVFVRPTKGTKAAGWAAPATVNVLAPFDFPQSVFVDSRGPTYKLAIQLREKVGAAGGKVKISIAKGTRGGKFRRLTTSTIGRDGRFTVRFKLRKAGKYRLRYSYKGSALIAPGTVTEGIRIVRRIVPR